MGVKPPHFIGIVGGSCSGKTWVAERLHRFLGKESARLSLDDFYLDRSHLSPARRARLNFDHPRAIDWPRLEATLKAFARGQPARVPKYDFAAHGRMAEEPLLSPAPIMIVEGLWLYRRASLRKAFDLKIYLRLPPEICAERRLVRDASERGRTSGEVMEQLRRYTMPMFEKFVAPQERWADLVVEKAPDEAWVAALAREIQKNLKTKSASL